MLRRLVSLFVLGLCLVACDPPTEVPSDTTVAPEPDVTCEPSTCPLALPETSDAAMPPLRIGTNTVGETAIESFTEALEGAEVPVMLGSQGGWMVVMAAATDAFSCCVERINIVASIATRDGSKVFGELKFKRRPFFEGPNEMRYLLNVWLVIGDPLDWEDREATMTVELEPYGGGEIIKKSVDIVLRRQTGAPIPVDGRRRAQ